MADKTEISDVVQGKPKTFNSRKGNLIPNSRNGTPRPGYQSTVKGCPVSPGSFDPESTYHNGEWKSPVEANKAVYGAKYSSVKE